MAHLLLSPKISISYLYSVVEEFEGDLALYGVDPEEIKKYEENFEGAVSKAILIENICSQREKQVENFSKRKQSRLSTIPKKSRQSMTVGLNQSLLLISRASLLKEILSIFYRKLCRTIFIFNLKSELVKNPFVWLVFVKNSTYLVHISQFFIH